MSDVVEPAQDPARSGLKRRVLVNTAALAVGNLWSLVLGAASLPLLLRGLGTEAFGLWVLLQTFSATTGWLSLADLGVGAALIRAVASKAAVGDRGGLATEAMSGLAVFGFLGLLAASALAVAGRALLPGAFGTGNGLRTDLEAAVVWFSVGVLFDLIVAGCTSCLIGLQRLDLARLVKAAIQTAFAVLACAVALGGGGIEGVAAVAAGTSAIGAIGAAAVLSHHVPLTRGGVRLASGLALLRYGFTVGALNGVGVVGRTMDRLIVGRALGPAAVALVEIATQVQNGASSFLASSSYSALSTAPWLHARDARRQLGELVLRGTKYCLLVTWPVVLGAAALSGPLVELWVGARYREAAGLVVVAVFYIAVAAPGTVASNMLEGVGRARAVLGCAALAMGVNLVTSLILVDQVGIVGAFIGTLLGIACFVPLVLRVALAEVGVSVVELFRTAAAPLVAPLLAFTAVLVGVRLLSWPPAATVVAGGGLSLLAYVGAAFRWSIGRGERQELRQLLFRSAPG